MPETIRPRPGSDDQASGSKPWLYAGLSSHSAASEVSPSAANKVLTPAGWGSSGKQTPASGVTAVSCGAPVGRGRVAEPESTPPRCYDSDALLRRQAAAQNGVGRRWPAGQGAITQQARVRVAALSCSAGVARSPRGTVYRGLLALNPLLSERTLAAGAPPRGTVYRGLLALDPLLGEWTPAAGAPAGGPALHVMGSYLPPPACHHAAIAQLGERQTEDLKVPGSIPGLGRLV